MGLTFSLLSILVFSADSVSYRVAAEQSRIVVEVGRAGFLKMFGHDHTIEARGMTGSVDWNASAPESSRFVLDIEAASFTVADEELSEEDRASVQADMESKALALTEHPTMRFESRDVRLEGRNGSSLRLKVSGTLSLRGVNEELEVPVNLTVEGDRLIARGEFELKSQSWGVPQISVAGGSVKTKEELGIDFEIVALKE